MEHYYCVGCSPRPKGRGTFRTQLSVFLNVSLLAVVSSCVAFFDVVFDYSTSHTTYSATEVELAPQCFVLSSPFLGFTDVVARKTL